MPLDRFSAPVLASIALAAACGGEERAGEPTQLQPAATNGNFVLLIANHSTVYDPLDIGINIDAESAVQGDFPSGTEYMFQFDLPLGVHNIQVNSIDTPAQRLILFQVVEGVSYGVLDYEDDDPTLAGTEPGFTWEFLDEPPAFNLD